MTGYLFRASAVGSLVLALAGCTSVLGDFHGSGADASLGGDGTVGTGDAQGSGDGYIDAPGIGIVCTSDTDCPTTFCTDGVCCALRCQGVCETCNAAGSSGQCTPIPVNTDPDHECVGVLSQLDGGTMLPDAAFGDGGPGGAADAGAAVSLDAALVEASAPEAGLNLPEGGVTVNQSQCTGTCSGQRACSFPGNTTSCGSQFCNTPAQVAHFTCDGAGNCSPELDTCANYTCAAGACKTNCTSPTDCLSTSFCNTQGTCQAQLGNGVACTLGNQCQSGNCVESVCCSSPCDFPGGTCTTNGAIGVCKCSVDCGDGGSCLLYYRDADGDGYGDKYGTVASGTAIVGCSNAAAPPTGFVASNTDCDDGDANANPAQAGWFTASSKGRGTFDYNCDGTIEKEQAEFPGSYCQFCGSTSATPACPTNPNGNGTCVNSGDQAKLSCTEGFVFCEIFLSVTEGLVEPAIIRPLECPECGPGDQAGFTSTVNCGATAAYTTCGSCSAANGGETPSSSSVTQACH